MKKFNLLVAKSKIIIIVLTVLAINITIFPKEVAADIYVYTDEDGVRHFTKVPTSSKYRLYMKSPHPPNNTMEQDAGIEWEILTQEAMELYRKGNYDRAVIVAKKSLEIAEKNVGPDHPDVAISLNNLAMLYQTQGQYTLAEPLYKRSLAISEKSLGPDHPDVARSLNNLAALYKTQGQYALAEPLYKRSLAIWEKSLGPNHPDVATSLENMADLYRKMGQKKAAEKLEKRAAKIRAIKR